MKQDAPVVESPSLSACRLSIIVPVFNEEENLAPLFARIHAALQDYGVPWELLIVDDGSRDATAARARRLAEAWGEHARVVQLQRNFGQTAAMQAGLDCARGDVMCTLDGDLQNDPADIPAMVARLVDEDLDLVVGWRRARQDGWLRRQVSRVANRLIARVTGVYLHDYGCSLKVYRGEVMRQVRLYGEMHRFIPAWVAHATHPHRIAEQVVRHHPRSHGRSKYGFSRTYRVILDLLAVYFFMRYRARPGHFFGSMGLMAGAVGGGCLVYLSLLKFITGADIGGRPLLLFGVLLVIAGVQLLTTGVLAEMATRTYYEASAARPYIIRQSGSYRTEDDAGWHEGGDVTDRRAVAAPPEPG